MRTVLTVMLALVVLLAGTMNAQAHFTLPKNVWRVSVVKEGFSSDWVSGGGKRGLPDEYFTLENYGLKYFDHLNPDSKKDLTRLNEHYVSATARVDGVITQFNETAAASAWGDSLADFSQNFFGSDSVTIGGYITNPKRTLAGQLTRFRFEYGLTERVTFALGIPHYSAAAQANQWGWRASHSSKVDLEGFIDYHSANKTKLESFLTSEHLATLSASLASDLQAVYDAFYTAGGSSSVLWVIEEGSDPFKSSIKGREFNPFSDSDTVTTGIDSLMAFYHPDRSTSGLGDIRWDVNVHLLGSPAWAGESLFSLYGGIGMTIPTGKLLQAFDTAKVDTTGRPGQLSQLPLGDGIAAWHASLFGEFYKTVRERQVKINWSAEFKLNPEGKFYPRVSPRGMFTVRHDTLLARLGEMYRLRRGDELFGSLAGSVELIPGRLSFSAGQTWYLKRRDTYYSKSEKWNEWMAGGTAVREGYDTQSVKAFQDFALILHNTDPMNQFGSTPFEIELSATLPVLTRHDWHANVLRFSFVTFFQFW